MKIDKLSLNLKVIYIAMFGSLACFFPFLTVYFQDKGLSYTQIGFVYAMWSITGVVTQPIWGYITDRTYNKKTTIMLTMGLSAVTIFGLVIANDFLFITLAVILFFSFQGSIVTLTDAYTYQIIDQNKTIQYGKVRFMGSIGYAITSLALGQVVKSFGINYAYMTYSIIIIIGMIFLHRIEFKGESRGIKISLKDIGVQLHDLRFSFFIIFVIIFSIPFGSNMSYISLLIKDVGGGFFELGMLGFIVALSEFLPLQFGSKILKKFGDINLLMFSMFFYAIRYLLNSMGTSSNMILAIQTMQCVTYPVFLIASYQFLSRTTPQNMRTTAMTIFGAAIGIGCLIGNIAGGLLLEQISVSSLYKVLSLTCLVCFFIAIVLKKINSTYKDEVVE